MRLRIYSKSIIKSNLNYISLVCDSICPRFGKSWAEYTASIRPPVNLQSAITSVCGNFLFLRFSFNPQTRTQAVANQKHLVKVVLRLVWELLLWFYCRYNVTKMKLEVGRYGVFKIDTIPVSDHDRLRHVRPRHDRPEISAEVTAVCLLWYAAPGRRLRDRRHSIQESKPVQPPPLFKPTGRSCLGRTYLGR